jgi:hypothetical protein
VIEPRLPPYNVGDLGEGVKRSAPAAMRNVAPIGEVLRDWLPESGLILEIASGTGEHALAFATQFPSLEWQPSDPDPLALASIAAWRCSGPANLLPPLPIDAAARDWPLDRADAVLCINMVHISPWASALGLLDGSSRLLPAGGALILYGPWIIDEVETAASNLAFDAELRRRDPRWGLRNLTTFKAEAERRGLRLDERRAMPANNAMLLFRRDPPAAA